MSILNVDKIQPIGGGSTITVDATDIQATSATITASKFVGSGDLSVTGVSTFTGDVIINGDELFIADSIKHVGDTDTLISFPSNDTIRFNTAGSERLRITSAGRIGINETSPDIDLHIKNTNPAIILEGTNGSGRQHKIWSAGTNSESLQFTSGNLLYNADVHYFRASNETTEYLRIASDGEVGIGTVNPNAPLDVFSNTAATDKDLFMVRSATGAFAVQCSNVSAANPEWRLRTYSSEPIVFSPGNVEKVRINSSGQVLIGGNSNSASSHADELQVINTSAEGGISIINGTSSTGHIYFGDTDAAAQGRIDYNHGGDYMRFYSANNERLRITSAGNIGIGTVTPESLPLTVAASTAAIALVDTDRTNSNYYSAVWGDQAGNLHLVADYEGAAGSQFISARVGGTALSNEKLRIDSSGRLQIGSTNNSSSGTRLVVGPGNNVASTALINTADTNINALTLSNWDGSATTNKVIMHFDCSGIAGFDVGIPAATTAFKISNTSGGGGYINLKSTGETKIYRSGVMMADINNSVQGHQFVSQCTDNNTGFEVYSQHGSTTTRNSFVVYDNRTGSKSPSFVVRGDGKVAINRTSPAHHLDVDSTSLFRNFAYFGSGGVIKSTAFSGGSAYDTGLSVNAHGYGAGMVFIASQNYNAGTGTRAGLYYVKFYYDGNNSAVTYHIAGDNWVTFGKSGSNTLTVTFGAGNNMFTYIGSSLNIT